MRHAIPLLASLLTGLSCLRANDNPFGFSGDACVAKHGELELQQTVSVRQGLDLGTGFDAGYRGYDLATQLEVGLSEVSHADLIVTGGVLRSADYRGAFLEGFSVEYKQLLGPSPPDEWIAAWAMAIGYSRVDAANGERRSEVSGFGRLFLQRNFGARGEWCYVTNLSAGLTHAAGGTCALLEWSQGLAYRASDAWSVGVEAVADGCWTHGRVFASSALCLGPSVAYRSGDCSVVCTHLWQVRGAPETDGHRNYVNTSRSETRLLVAWAF